ncbi:MAG: GerMN domain-containing protein [Acidobacteria bacterium]|nr:GerMN domain-containing protein [Acidobacteriota bacterium]
MKPQLFQLLCVLPLVLLLLPIGAAAQTREVTVYFWEFNRDEPGDDMIPFKRVVDAKAPLRPTIEALIAGPTETEVAGKYSGVAYGDLKLSDVRVKGSTARIDFVREIRDDYYPGDLETLRFEATVIRTAKQFPNIKMVIVCVNGINEFGIGMVEDRPRPCPSK